MMFNYISCYKTKKGDRIAYLGLRRLHRGIIYPGVIIYSWPYFGVFDVEEILEWLGWKGKGLHSSPFLLW